MEANAGKPHQGRMPLPRKCAAAPAASAFTLIELLVSISVVLLLMAILVPVIGMIRDRAKAASSNELVMSITMAMKVYADEDPRHFHPTPAASKALVYDVADLDAALTLLERFGWRPRIPSIDRDPASPTFHQLLDGWNRAIRYDLDGAVRVGGVIDGSRMNGIADKPAPQADWNPRGAEPWAYVWSIGRPTAGEAADADPVNAARWLYERGTP